MAMASKPWFVRNHWPRSLVMRASGPLKYLRATPPKAMMTLGAIRRSSFVKDAMGAESGFFRRWCPVVPRPALNDVCCKDMVPCDFDGPERLIQELSAGADKGTAIVILDAAWSFADNDEGTVGIPKPANRSNTVTAQGTGCTIFHFSLEYVQFFHPKDLLIYAGIRWLGPVSGKCPQQVP